MGLASSLGKRTGWECAGQAESGEATAPVEVLETAAWLRKLDDLF